ncbi:DUF6191 domain-containing protein [Streptomyces sp. 1222.5]|uniref:DUF6191 domain-containing protein n=1 Tax=Streptomyces sp. 1222.5 TaxID=1881026 RepID=UPI003EB77A3D
MIVAATPFPRRGVIRRRPDPAGAHGALSPGRQHELTERRSSLVLRDDEDRAPPHRSTVDPRSGTAVIRVTPGRLRS